MKFDELKLYTHHEHLGGSVPPHLLWEIAKNRGINLPAKTYTDFISMFNNDQTITFDDYVIDKFAMVHKTQTSAESVGKCFYAAGSKMVRESNIAGAEIRFNPAFRNGNGTYDLDEVIINACVNARRVSLHYGVDISVIIEGDRRQTMDLVEILANKAIKYKSLGIAGFDLSGPYSGPDVNYQLRDYAHVYKHLRENGIGLTVHADENTTGTKRGTEVEEALIWLKPDRIGHGIQSTTRPDIMAELSDKDICLEICPTSNVVLRSVSGWDYMGSVIHKLLDNDVAISINTDGRELLGVSLKEEYKNLIERGYITSADAAMILSDSERFMFKKLKKSIQ